MSNLFPYLQLHSNNSAKLNTITWQEFFEKKGRKMRVLTLAGGGIRLIVLCQMLMELEERINRPIHEAFDMIVGTSAGAIASVCIGLLKMSAMDLYKIAIQMKDQVFDPKKKRSLPIPSFHDVSRLEALLQNVDPNMNLKFSDFDPLEHPLVAACAVRVTEHDMFPFLFRNYRFENVEPKNAGSVDYKLWEGCRASSAAPIYFQPFADRILQRSFIDGGILANNPTGLALMEIQQLFCIPNQLRLENVLDLVVTLGTGEAEQNDTSAKYKQYYQSILQNDSKIWTSMKDLVRIKDVINILAESATGVSVMNNLMEVTLKTAGVKYVNLNPVLSHLVELDETNEQKIVQMTEDTQRYIELQNQIFNRVTLWLNSQ